MLNAATEAHRKYNLRVPLVPVVLLLLAAFLLPSRADDKTPPKPEVKSVSIMAVRVGHTEIIKVYGENLAPKEVKAAKNLLTVKLGESKATEGGDKSKGSRQVALEVVVPPNCPPDTYTLTLVNTDNTTAEAKIAVVPDTVLELPVKHPAGTFTKAMPLSGPSVGVTGTLNNDAPEVFKFEAKRGEKWRIELLAGRVGSAMDPVMRVRNSRHVSLAISAGDPKKDRIILFTVPEDGTYYIEFYDDQGRGGPTFVYRLSLHRIALESGR